MRSACTEENTISQERPTFLLLRGIAPGVVVDSLVVTPPAWLSDIIDTTENHHCIAAPCPEVMYVLCADACYDIPVCDSAVRFITPVAV